MEQKFKIMNILNFQFSKIDELEDVTDESIKNNMTHGVWVLFGRKKEQLWTCLQVGQSSNIGLEIISDVECLSGKRKISEDKTKSYINQFGKVVQGYEYHVYPTPREQIYTKMGKEYKDFVFVCICCGENYKDNKKLIEKYAAWKLRVLFWRNGRPFKVKKENVEEPDNIDEIDFNEKEMIDKMADWYKKQQQK